MSENKDIYEEVQQKLASWGIDVERVTQALREEYNLFDSDENPITYAEYVITGSDMDKHWSIYDGTKPEKGDMLFAVVYANKIMTGSLEDLYSVVKINNL